MTSATAMASSPKTQGTGKTVPRGEQRYTRDRVLMRVGMKVWFFDPYDDGKLKETWIHDLNCHGPELYVNGRILAYSRRAVWADKNEAQTNGPPHEVYTYSRKAGNLAGA